MNKEIEPSPNDFEITKVPNTDIAELYTLRSRIPEFNTDTYPCSSIIQFNPSFIISFCCSIVK